jgi:hypothetical protein
LGARHHAPFLKPKAWSLPSFILPKAIAGLAAE